MLQINKLIVLKTKMSWKQVISLMNIYFLFRKFNICRFVSWEKLWEKTLSGEPRNEGKLLAETKVWKILKKNNSNAQKGIIATMEKKKSISIYNYIYIYIYNIAITPFCYLVHRKIRDHQKRTGRGKETALNKPLL